MITNTNLHAVKLITGVDRRLANCLELTRWREVLLISHHLLAPLFRDQEVVPIDSRCGSKDTVIVLGVSLSLHKTLPASSRTPIPVGVLRSLSIKFLYDDLRKIRHIIKSDRGEVLEVDPVDISRTG